MIMEDTMMEKAPREKLLRNIGPLGLGAAVINMTVGTGIFVLPALVSENLGAASIICFFICGFLIFLIALCFAEVGSKVIVSGGPYTYIEMAFGPFAGFVANSVYLAGCIFADAAVAYALLKTLELFLPLSEFQWVPPVFYLLLFGGLAWINIRGSKYGLGFVVFSTFAKLIPLLLLVSFGFHSITTGNLQWKHVITVEGISNSTLILFFAFLGIESAVINGGEFKKPERTVPLGILYGLSFVLFLYISIQVVTQGILGNSLQTFKDAPLVEASHILFGPLGITIMIIGTAASMLGTLSGSVLANPRSLFAGARDGIYPGFLFRVHPKFLTPHISIIVYVMCGYLLAVFGIFKELVILTSAFTLLVYFGVALATIRLRHKERIPAPGAFKIPGGFTVPILTSGIILWILSSLSRQELIGMVISVLGITVLFVMRKWFKKPPKPVPQTNSKE